MAQPRNEPKIFIEMVLILLEDRFPWLGRDVEAAGADAINQLNELHESLLRARAAKRIEPQHCSVRTAA
jgi:hypothetical protein